MFYVNSVQFAIINAVVWKYLFQLYVSFYISIYVFKSIEDISLSLFLQFNCTNTLCPLAVSVTKLTDSNE